MKKKFRMGCSEMKHAFQELDIDRTGRVTKDEFRRVLKEFGLKLSSEKQVEDFLARLVLKREIKMTYLGVY